MNTFDIHQAADFLCMSVSALGNLARTGKIKAAKPAKRWVFLESDLVAYLDHLYHGGGQSPQRSCKEESLQWQYKNAEIRGGSISGNQMGSEYAVLLGLPTS